MKPKILYIENDKDHIKKVRNLLKDEYDIIPDESEIELLTDEITKGNINGFVRDKIQNNYQNLRMIICDLELIEGNKDGGADVIKFIRKELEVPEKILLPKLIPIIILTNYSDFKYAKSALENGATHNIDKKNIDKNFFKDIVMSMIRYYTRAYLERDFDYLKYGLNDINKELEKLNNFISFRFDNLEIMVQGEHEEALAKFDLLFNFLFKSFNSDTQQKIFESFKTELENIISPEQQKQLEETTWDKIKKAIKEVNKGGGFKAFVDTSYELLEQAGVLDVIPQGKFIGITIKGIFGILASN